MADDKHNRAETPPARIYPTLYPEKLNEQKKGKEKLPPDEELTESEMEWEEGYEPDDPPEPGEGP